MTILNLTAAQASALHSFLKNNSHTMLGQKPRSERTKQMIRGLSFPVPSYPLTYEGTTHAWQLPETERLIPHGEGKWYLVKELGEGLQGMAMETVADIDTSGSEIKVTLLAEEQKLVLKILFNFDSMENEVNIAKEIYAEKYPGKTKAIIFDIENEPDVPCAVFPKCPGYTLSEIFDTKSEIHKKFNKMNYTDRLNLIVIPLFNMLKAIHEKGIYHGDLSVINILVDLNSEVNAIDFGKSYKMSSGDNKHQLLQEETTYILRYAFKLLEGVFDHHPAIKTQIETFLENPALHGVNSFEEVATYLREKFTQVQNEPQEIAPKAAVLKPISPVNPVGSEQIKETKPMPIKSRESAPIKETMAKEIIALQEKQEDFFAAINNKENYCKKVFSFFRGKWSSKGYNIIKNKKQEYYSELCKLLLSDIDHAIKIQALAMRRENTNVIDYHLGIPVGYTNTRKLLDRLLSYLVSKNKLPVDYLNQIAIFNAKKNLKQPAK